MKYPYILQIVYIGGDAGASELSIHTNESNHYMQSNNDVDIACDLLNVFSEIVWNEDKFNTLLSAGKFIGEFEEISATVI